MQINKLDCSRPKRHINNFKGDINSNNSKRIRRKHYEQMSDDVLKAKSMVKAYYDVKQSPKGQLIKAMPEITTSLLVASLALTQPGKLSAKAAAGLGFLALFKSLNSTQDAVNKAVDKHYEKFTPEKNTEKNKFALKTATFVATSALLSGLAFVGAKAGKKIANKHFSPVVNFIQKESANLANEINNTKLGKFFENKVMPFTQKHHKAASVVKTVLPFGVLAGEIGAQSALLKSAKKDMINKTFENYTKGKLIQEKARQDFDSIDAIEV